MKTLNIDTGVEEFSVNGRGVLRFNPGDPNLYHRFFALGRDLAALDGELEQKLAALLEAGARRQAEALADAAVADADAARAARCSP